MHPRLCLLALRPILSPLRHPVLQSVHMPIRFLKLPPLCMGPARAGGRGILSALPRCFVLLFKVFRELVEEKVEELVRVLVHVAAEELVLLLEPLYEALGGDHARLLLLRANLQAAKGMSTFMYLEKRVLKRPLSSSPS